MGDHVSNLFIVISGCISVAIGYLFDVPPAVLWAAAIGASGGVALSRTIDKVQGFALIVSGTIVTGFAVGLLAKRWPDYSAKSMAFFVALILIGYRAQILAGVPRIINASIDGMAGWATRIGEFFSKVGSGEK